MSCAAVRYVGVHSKFIQKATIQYMFHTGLGIAVVVSPLSRMLGDTSHPCLKAVQCISCGLVLIRTGGNYSEAMIPRSQARPGVCAII